MRALPVMRRLFARPLLFAWLVLAVGSAVACGSSSDDDSSNWDEMVWDEDVWA